MESDALKADLHKQGIEDDLWQQAMNSKSRIEKISTPQGVFWLKKAAPARGIFRYHALNLFSWLLRLPLLRAVPQPGGTAAIANEVNRIHDLKKAGVAVPSLIAHAADWLLLKDVGSSIIREMKQANTDQRRRQKLFAACLQAIKQLHLAGHYLSQGFIRNMLLQDDQDMRVAFIDFEDDPLTVMTLPEAQARDVLLLVNSTARFFMNDRNYFDAQIQQFIQGHDPEMVSALRITSERMQWIAKIPFQGLLGHDYQKLKVGILALKNL